ncbi:MAG TPA: hypothetical protein VFF69_02650 [Phycisphaerales bacterium]|nr:hypothetical protein [Phycisphaerales bacterium]
MTLNDQPPQISPATSGRPHHTLYGPPCHEDLTLDGERVRVGGVYYCRARLHPPFVRVRVVKQHRTTRSWLDGALVLLWEAEPEDARDGHRVIVEPWMLSTAPVDEVLRRLQHRT